MRSPSVTELERKLRYSTILWAASAKTRGWSIVSTVHVPSHDLRVACSAGTLLAVVVLIPVCLVDNLLRYDLLDDVCKSEHVSACLAPPRIYSQRTFKRDDPNRAALVPRRRAQQQQVRPACLATEETKAVSRRTHTDQPKNSQVIERLEAVDRRIGLREYEQRKFRHWQSFRRVVDRQLSPERAAEYPRENEGEKRAGTRCTFFRSSRPKNASGRPGACTGMREYPLCSLSQEGREFDGQHKYRLLDQDKSRTDSLLTRSRSRTASALIVTTS